MTTPIVNLCPVLKQQFLDNNGLPLASGQVFTYIAGTSTLQSTYQDASGTSTNTNPITLDASGRANIWTDITLMYKFVVKDVNSVTLYTEDDIPGTSTGQVISIYAGTGIAVTGHTGNVVISTTPAAFSEWQLGSVPLFVSTTSFTVTGNQTGTYTQGRQIKAQVTSGTVYGQVTNAVYSTLTTVTVKMSGAANLDSGLTTVWYGLFDPQNPSYLMESAFAEGGGSANAITATFYGANAVLNDGQQYLVESAADNTSKTVTLTLTLNTVAQPTYNIVKGDGLLLVAGDIQTNQILYLTYDAFNTYFVLGNPATGVLGESVSVINALGNITGSVAIDISLGAYVWGTLTGNTTFTFTNPSPTGYAQGFTLEIINGGAHTITWPASVKWAGGIAASLITSGKDTLAFSTRDAGTTWLGYLTGRDIK